MSVPSKLEATIEISELPTPETVENGWQHFMIDCEGREVSVTVKPKVWKKLTTADEQYESWVAAVTSGASGLRMRVGKSVVMGEIRIKRTRALCKNDTSSD